MVAPVKKEKPSSGLKSPLTVDYVKKSSVGTSSKMEKEGRTASVQGKKSEIKISVPAAKLQFEHEVKLKSPKMESPSREKVEMFKLKEWLGQSLSINSEHRHTRVLSSFDLLSSLAPSLQESYLRSHSVATEIMSETVAASRSKRVVENENFVSSFFDLAPWPDKSIQLSNNQCSYFQSLSLYLFRECGEFLDGILTKSDDEKSWDNLLSDVLNYQNLVELLCKCLSPDVSVISREIFKIYSCIYDRWLKQEKSESQKKIDSMQTEIDSLKEQLETANKCTPAAAMNLLSERGPMDAQIADLKSANILLTNEIRNSNAQILELRKFLNDPSRFVAEQISPEVSNLMSELETMLKDLSDRGSNARLNWNAFDNMVHLVNDAGAKQLQTVQNSLQEISSLKHKGAILRNVGCQTFLECSDILRLTDLEVSKVSEEEPVLEAMSPRGTHTPRLSGTFGANASLNRKPSISRLKSSVQTAHSKPARVHAPLCKFLRFTPWMSNISLGSLLIQHTPSGLLSGPSLGVLFFEIITDYADSILHFSFPKSMLQGFENIGIKPENEAPILVRADSTTHVPLSRSNSIVIGGNNITSNFTESSEVSFIGTLHYYLSAKYTTSNYDSNIVDYYFSLLDVLSNEAPESIKSSLKEFLAPERFGNSSLNVLHENAELPTSTIARKLTVSSLIVPDLAIICRLMFSAMLIGLVPSFNLKEQSKSYLSIIWKYFFDSAISNSSFQFCRNNTLQEFSPVACSKNHEEQLDLVYGNVKLIDEWSFPNDNWEKFPIKTPRSLWCISNNNHSYIYDGSFDTCLWIPVIPGLIALTHLLISAFPGENIPQSVNRLFSSTLNKLGSSVTAAVDLKSLSIVNREKLFLSRIMLDFIVSAYLPTYFSTIWDCKAAKSVSSSHVFCGYFYNSTFPNSDSILREKFVRIMGICNPKSLFDISVKRSRELYISSYSFTSGENISPFALEMEDSEIYRKLFDYIDISNKTELSVTDFEKMIETISSEFVISLDHIMLASLLSLPESFDTQLKS